MNLERVKIWGHEVLYAAELNAEFDNILQHDIEDADFKADADIQLSKLETATNGDIAYYNSGWKKLNKGTNDQVLKLVGGLPAWGDL